MEQTRHINRMMHDDHMAVSALLERLGTLLREPSPPPADTAVKHLLGDLSGAVRGEIATHFAFEEEALFPCLAATGDGDMGDLLSEEHRVILPLAQRLAALADEALAAGAFDSQAWAEFRRTGGAFVESLGDHVAKEEMSLLSALDDAIDADADDRLVEDYMTRR